MEIIGLCPSLHLVWLVQEEENGRCYEQNHALANANVEVLIPNVIVFGDRAFREVIIANLGHKSGALI